MPIEKVDPEKHRKENVMQAFGGASSDITQEIRCSNIAESEKAGLLLTVMLDLDTLFDNPQYLGLATPTEWYELLQKYGHDVTLLTKGNYKSISFIGEGGGFKVNWGGDRILMYHPKPHSGNGNYGQRRRKPFRSARKLYNRASHCDSRKNRLSYGIFP